MSLTLLSLAVLGPNIYDGPAIIVPARWAGMMRQARLMALRARYQRQSSQAEVTPPLTLLRMARFLLRYCWHVFPFDRSCIRLSDPYYR